MKVIILTAIDNSRRRHIHFSVQSDDIVLIFRTRNLVTIYTQSLHSLYCATRHTLGSPAARSRFKTVTEMDLKMNRGISVMWDLVLSDLTDEMHERRRKPPNLPPLTS